MTNPISAGFHGVMSDDATLAALLATYKSAPAVFTTDPVPGDAVLPYIVTAGETAHRSFDTKTTRGREFWRDVRCYAATNGSAVTVEAMAERVRALFHRQAITIAGFGVVITECSGPVVADEPEAYGRIVTVRIIMMEE